MQLRNRGGWMVGNCIRIYDYVDLILLQIDIIKQCIKRFGELVFILKIA